MSDMKSQAEVGGVFEFAIRRNGVIIDQWEQHNLVPNAGLNHILDVIFGNDSPESAWYIGLYSNAYTPQADDLYTHIGTRFTEVTTAYSESVRQTFTDGGGAVAGVESNTASRATFTFTSGATINGAFVVNVSAKGDNTSGLMLAASAASPARTVTAGDELLVKYTFTATSS